MIKSIGNNYVKFQKSDFSQLVRQLSILEGYIFAKNKSAMTADYWGVCEEGGEEDTIVKLADGLAGKPLGITWQKIEKLFPDLIAELDKHGLHYYIGKNYVGNWGVHRHIYDESSTMNLCLLVNGNNGGTVNFHEFDDDAEFFDELSDDHIFDLHHASFEEGTITESVKIKDGDCYSFNTGVWHSHIVQGEKAELFLLHFRDAISVHDLA
jgi:hypothetical protein